MPYFGPRETKTANWKFILFPQIQQNWTVSNKILKEAHYKCNKKNTKFWTPKIRRKKRKEEKGKKYKQETKTFHEMV